ncbi:MAG: nucleotidyltransferase domain-containing protein [Nanoarchaeota archaeon]
MIQKCSIIQVMEVFFKEPTSIHFIREISKKIRLAPTSVKIYINNLLKEELIISKKSKPFDGYVANRENEKFLFYKRLYNQYSLYELKEKIIDTLSPKAIVLFGSYDKGEDIESSDIDILLISKIKKDINLGIFEKELNRKINIMIISDLNELDKNIEKKIINATKIYGEI